MTCIILHSNTLYLKHVCEYESPANSGISNQIFRDFDLSKINMMKSSGPNFAYNFLKNDLKCDFQELFHT